jgi:DNA-binding transcriptional MerR regulator
MAAQQRIFGIGPLCAEITKRNGVSIRPWMVRRLEEEGLLTTPQRVGPHRIYFVRDIPRVETALRRRGRLPGKCKEVAQ